MPWLLSRHFLNALQLLLLENVRFYKEEEKNDAEFAKKVCVVMIWLFLWVGSWLGCWLGLWKLETRPETILAALTQPG